MEFIQVLRRFFSVRGLPSVIISDNGTQFVGAERELKEMIRGWDTKRLRKFSAEKGVQWRFITPASPHQNRCAEALVKSCKVALKKAVGEQILTPFELYTCLLEVANLVNERPIGPIPNDPDDGSYVCPNDMLLGQATSHMPQGNQQSKSASGVCSEDCRLILEVLDMGCVSIINSTKEMERRKEKHASRRFCNSGNWNIGRIVNVYPGQDGKVRNIRVKTGTGEYDRPVTKIVVVHLADGYE